MERYVGSLKVKSGSIYLTTLLVGALPKRVRVKSIVVRMRVLITATALWTRRTKSYIRHSCNALGLSEGSTDFFFLGMVCDAWDLILDFSCIMEKIVHASSRFRCSACSLLLMQKPPPAAAAAAAWRPSLTTLLGNKMINNHKLSLLLSKKCSRNFRSSAL